MNEELNDELNKKLEKGYQRMSIFVFTWGIIGALPIFIIPNNYLLIYTIIWYTWMLYGILISPKMLKKFWRD